jgi:hypothetical protein
MRALRGGSGCASRARGSATARVPHERRLRERFRWAAICACDRVAEPADITSAMPAHNCAPLRSPSC